MEIAGDEVVWPVVFIAAVALAAMVAALLDLSRHDVRHLPKWAWALIIVLVSFPIGAIVYVVVGRVPAGERPVVEHPPVPPPTIDDGRRLQRSVDLADVVVATHDLTKTYGATVALGGVDLAVPRGAIYGLIGPNGAGKTTMMSIPAGLRRPSSGTVELAVPRRSMGVLVDTPQFEPWLTATRGRGPRAAPHRPRASPRPRGRGAVRGRPRTAHGPPPTSSPTSSRSPTSWA